MRTKNLLGSVALVALFGGTAYAQDLVEMPNDGRLTMEMDDAGEPVLNDAGEPMVMRADGTEADPEEYRIDEGNEIILLVQADEAETAVEAEGETAVDVEGEAAVGEGQLVVEQGEASVDVEVPDPTVTVDQATPEVTVEQPTPEITVQVAPPTVNVEQQQPVITVEQQQPVVTVRIPEPIVTIRMPQPTVEVAQGEPEVALDVPEPQVRFIQPEPEIRVEQAEPQVNVSQAEPQIDINRTTEADVQIEQAEADVQVEEEGEAEVNVTDAEPMVEVEQAEGAEVEVEQEEAQIDVEQQEADVRVVDEAAVADLQTEGYIVSADAEETEEVRTQRMSGYEAYSEMTVDDLVGAQVVASDGEEVGEIDNIALIGDRLVAIVGIGGFLGIGEHDVALPLERLAMDGESMVADGLTAERFQNFPAYDEAQAEFVPTDGRIGDLYE